MDRKREEEKKLLINRRLIAYLGGSAASYRFLSREANLVSAGIERIREQILCATFSVEPIWAANKTPVLSSSVLTLVHALCVLAKRARKL